MPKKKDTAIQIFFYRKNDSTQRIKDNTLLRYLKINNKNRKYKVIDDFQQHPQQVKRYAFKQVNICPVCKARRVEGREGEGVEGREGEEGEG